MKRDLIIHRVAVIVLMIVFLWLTVTFAGDNGMGICFILFYVVNPVFAVLSGMLGGTDVKKLWRLPIYTAMAFLLGTWLFFDIGEIAFVLYAGVYLVLGLISMMLTVLFENKKKFKKIFIAFVLLLALVGLWILWSGSRVDVQLVLPDKAL